MDDLEVARHRDMRGERVADKVLVADEDHPQKTILPAGPQRRGDRHGRRLIAAHRVDDDGGIVHAVRQASFFSATAFPR